MSETRLRLGETLVEAGILTQEALEKALAIQKKRQLRLGTILLQEGFVSESQLVQALSLKLSIPWVSLWRIDVPDELLELVPSNVAEEFFLMPIYIRTSKTGERVLYVAMNDPSDEDALRFVSANAGMPVKPMIAGPTDIAAAIRAYYYDEEEEYEPIKEVSSDPIPPPVAQAAPPPPPPQAPAAQLLEDDDIEELDEGHLEEEVEEPEEVPIDEIAVEHEEEQPEKEDDKKEAPEAESEDSAQDPEDDDKVFADKTAAQREAERRIYGVGASKPKGGFSLTLLDGTTLSFGPGKKKAKPSENLSTGKLTKEDLLSGLKAAAQGTPIDDFLPSANWESYMAAILKVLFNKHLVFFEEFLKELEQIEKK